MVTRPVAVADDGGTMSQKMHAKLVPYSSVVGQSIAICNGPEGRVVAQLAVMAPSGPPMGEDHKAFVQRIARIVADAINGMQR